MKHFEKKEIAKKSEAFSDWYTDVILKAELADYAPVKGCMVIRPYGFALWEHIQAYLDKKFKDLGVENAYFPLFIPYSFLQKEKEHLEGFSPELAVVTHGGGEKLAEPLVVRPTSETIMYDSYAKWIQSWRDLPLLLNVWNSVVRWEKRTYLFLRTSEFLWQEGHTAHATFDEADQFAGKILSIYRKFDEDVLGLSVVVGKKSKSEKFAGAAITYTLEALMPDGKALQVGTSHHLGDNFARAFNIQYLDREGKRQYVHQTSWAETTRVIGAIIMAHGDDDGLMLPPEIAPIQVVIVPIIGASVRNVPDNAKRMVKYVTRIKDELHANNKRVQLDSKPEFFQGDVSYEESIGRKLNKWELKGVPLRFEIGDKEIEQDSILVYRRDTKEKKMIKQSDIINYTNQVLKEIQQNLFDKHKKFTQEHTYMVDSYDEFKKIMNTTRGFIRALWCENADCEKKIKEETKATTRCLPLDAKKEKGICIYCKKPASHRWYFAQAY